MPNPNWLQFAQLTATPELLDFLSTMGVDDPPPDGRPRRFQAYRRDERVVSVNVERYRDSGRTEFVVYDGQSSRYLSTAKDIRMALKIPYDTPTAKALLRWLRWWGLGSPDAAPPAPNDQTRMVT